MAHAPNALLTAVLKDVSRSFYLTLRALPESIRPQISLAYLLARTSDTIADTELVPPEQRLDSLQRFRKRILGATALPLDFDELTRHQGAPAERVLLEKCEASLALLEILPPADQQLVRDVLNLITSGQELDLRRFAGASSTQMVALRSDAELEDYTYRVAGCVGEFWTRICRLHVFPKARLEVPSLLARSVEFGKGLQLVNILRDLPADLRKGRCYLPIERLAAAGLSSAGLLLPANEPALRLVYDSYLDRAEEFLSAGWVYTNTLPWRCARVRLACAWPILIGFDTIRRLRAAHTLNQPQPVKISRHRVRQIVVESVLLYPCPPAWRRLHPQPARLPTRMESGKAVASGSVLT